MDHQENGLSAAIRHDVDAYGGMKALAYDAGVRVSTVCKWIQSGRIPLKIVNEFFAPNGLNHTLEYLASMSGQQLSRDTLSPQETVGKIRSLFNKLERFFDPPLPNAA